MQNRKERDQKMVHWSDYISGDNFEQYFVIWFSFIHKMKLFNRISDTPGTMLGPIKLTKGTYLVFVVRQFGTFEDQWQGLTKTKTVS